MKRAAILLAFGAVLLLPAGVSRAQTGAARGKVVDEQGQPVEGAKIEIVFKGGVTRKYETKTNKKGEYTQVGLQSGNYEVTASKEGYQNASGGTRVSLGDPTYLPDLKMRSGKAVAAEAAASGNDLKTNFNKALELTQAGKLDEAEAAYKELLAKAPSIPEIHYNLAFVYTQKKDWPNAEASFLKALELKPDYSDATAGLARVYQDSGQPDKAMALMSKSAAGGDGKSQFNMGIMLMNQNKDEEALAAFQKAAELDPANAESFYYIGTRSMQLGRLPESVAALEKYVSMNPKNAQNLAAAQALIPALKAALPKK